MKLLLDKRSWFALFSLVAVAVTFLAAKQSKSRALSGESDRKVILWAWERPEDLRFIDSRTTGVAFLAKTITLRDATISIRPRLQPFEASNGTTLTAVARIESDSQQRPVLSDEQLENTADAIVAMSKFASVSTVQIDFDAVTSEHDFYRRLLIGVRQRLPANTKLSITALASWCEGDNWLSDLPIDEAVPMLFRMGVDGPRFAARVQSGENFPASPCNSAAGISTDEKINWPHDRKVYIFSPVPWTKENFKNAMEAMKR
jgi:uncharacterized protein DUF3142